jgi:hypothetical protein
MILPASALAAFCVPGVIDKDLPHNPGGNAEEVSPVLPRDLVLIYQPNIRFVHQGRRLQYMSGMLASHMPAGNAMKLILNQGNQFIQTLLVSTAPT